MSLIHNPTNNCPTQFYRAKLEESILDNEDQSKAKVMKAIELTRLALKKAPLTSVGSQADVLLEGKQDVSQLITIREAHQTK